MAGGKSPRQKGDRFERWLVNQLREDGFAAERHPGSGAAGGSFAGDLTVPLLGDDLVLEAKHRANGFREAYQWLEDRNLLALKADRRDPLIVLPWALFRRLIRAAEKNKETIFHSTDEAA